MNLWLDDMRPAPVGWRWAKTVEEAKTALLTGDVVDASFDHDLGACDACMNGRSPEQWLEEHGYREMPQCEHFGNGYQLICWMEEFGHWPTNKPTVHSRNPVGRAKMQLVIDKHYGV